MKTVMAAVELAAVINELDHLAGARIEKIYQPEKKDFLFHLHVPGKGKHLLSVRLGKYLFLTSTKPSQTEPSQFCIRLRKLLTRAIITSFQQVGGQRVAQMQIETKQGPFRVIFELFSTGNLVVTDANSIIVLLQQRAAYAGRELTSKAKYEFPKSSHGWSEVDQKLLKEILATTETESLVKAFAIDLGLGGLYAEELVHRVGLDKNQPPAEVNQKQVKKLFETLQGFIKELREPRGYLYGEEMVPVKLDSLGTFDHQVPTFNELIDERIGKSQADVVRQRLEEKFAVKLKKVQNIIDAQEKTVEKLAQKSAEDQRRGELIFERYQQLNDVVEQIKNSVQKEGWDATAKKLKKGKLVKQVNLKEKKIVLELPDQ